MNSAKLISPPVIVPYYDRIHPYTTADYAHKMIPSSQLFDFDPTRHANTIMTDTAAARDEKPIAEILYAMDKGHDAPAIDARAGAL